MMKKLLLVSSLALWGVGASPLAAQQTGTIQGTVVEATTQRPLASVQVVIVGTQLGSLTNAQGRFQIVNVPPGQHTVRAQLVGYGSTEASVRVEAGSASTVTLSLQTTAVALEGVVVTALGIEREQRTLGVAAQTLQSEQLTRVEPNIVNSFSGKIAGVNITNAGPQGGSSRIVIRGESSITGNNQPLFIVDGVPIDNYATGQYLNTGQGGFDYGNAVQDLSPDIIESVTVLKGPNAAALYGSRASNGVVLITTRKGAGARAAEVIVSQTTSFEDELRLPRFQNRFGQGDRGRFAYFDGAGNGLNDEFDESWGPPLDVGLLIPQYNSPFDPATGERVPLPWVSHPNNVNEFFELGRTLNTNVTVAAGTDRLSGRFGINRLDQNGMVPGMKLGRTTLSFGGTMNATDRLDLNTSIQYIEARGENRPGIAYGSDNPMGQFIWGARQLDIADLRRNWNTPRPDNDPMAGLHYNWNYYYWNNPYFLQYANGNTDERNRLIGQLQAAYKLSSWLTASARTGTDWYQDERLKMYAANTVGGLYTTSPLTLTREYVGENGAFATWGNGFQETNSDFLLIANPTLNLPVTVSATFGGNRRDSERRVGYAWVGNLATPGVFDVSNAAVTPTLFTETNRKRVNSLLGQVDFGYNDYLFLTLTGRNDWSSTLPESNRSYFYPSVSTSFVFSDALPFFRNTPLSYGKLRASWAQVGNDTDPYQLRNTFTADDIFGTLPTFTVPGILKNENLRPEITESVEFGVELGLVGDRLGLDVTYYDAETRDQIMPVQISRSTGYTSQIVNAGTVRNHGWEALVRAMPIRTDNFQWETSFSYSRNRNKVLALADGVEGLELSIGDFWGVQNFARVGEPLGQLVGPAYQRDPEGRIIVSQSLGVPLWTAEPQVLGNSNPDWRGGWSNTLSYGGARLNFLFDIRRGGDVFSVTHLFGRFAGVLEETAVGRCTPERLLQPGQEVPVGYPVCTAQNGIIIDGVNRIVNGSDTTYVKNETVVDAQTRWLYAYLVPEAHMVDASYVKLREMTLSYNLPQALTQRMRLNGLQIALVGRNLALWTENDHIDPETAFDNTNVQGLEYAQMPSARSIGFTITVRP